MAPIALGLLTLIPSSSLLHVFLLAMLTISGLALQESIISPTIGDASWHKNVRAPPSNNISPITWVSEYTVGNIENPGGIIGDGTTIITRNGPGEEIPSIVLDFGQNYAGILNIDFAGSALSPQASRNRSSLPGITLAFSETLEFLTNRSDFTRSDNQGAGEKYTNGTDQIAVKKHPYVWTNHLGCQYSQDQKVCSDGFHGFRYLKIALQALPEDAPYTTGFGSVSISSVDLTYSGYLGTPDTFTGWFECSDKNLTQWWYDAVYTNDLATDVFRANDTEPRDAASHGLVGKEVLHDGAKRDRDPYAGDLAVSALTLYLSHDNAAAARNVLADLANNQRADGWIPPASINDYTLELFDYPLWWVVCSCDLVLYTGDTDYLDTYYPNLVKTLDTYYPDCTNSDGLLQKGLGNSAGYGDYAFIPRHGVITYYNALYVLALTRAAQLADIQGRPRDAARWRARAAAVGPALVRENWDRSAGAFFDGGPCPDNNGTAKCPVHAQDGNSLAILSGAVENTAAKSAVGGGSTPEESILSHMSSALARPYGNAFYDSSILSPGDSFDKRVYAFISYFELSARFQVGRKSFFTSDVVETAYEELRRLYGWMASHDPYSTFWEGIGLKGRPYQAGYTSLAHGWSSGIVPLMSNYVLGVTPTAPGFEWYDLRPTIEGGGLTWARGQVPTPFGPIRVSWRVGRSAGGRVKVTVSSPERTTGKLYMLVADGDSEMKRDGETVWARHGREAVDGVAFQGEGLAVTIEGGSSHVFELA